MTSKGQVTVPVELRTLLGLRPRDRAQFELDGDTVRLRRARSRLLEGYGIAKPHQMPEDFRAVRDAVEHRIAEEVVAEE